MKTSPSFRNVLYVTMSCPVPAGPLVYTFLVRHVTNYLAGMMPGNAVDIHALLATNVVYFPVTTF